MEEAVIFLEEDEECAIFSFVFFEQRCEYSRTDIANGQK